MGGIFKTPPLLQENTSEPAPPTSPPCTAPPAPEPGTIVVEEIVDDAPEIEAHTPPSGNIGPGF